ncbi:hypothetical protein [Sphingomonas asaccharolytica]|uniref:hypothetical protein n=1 Tax=Sphingomonas asaccharolytica TaxID=40681 RepID=UPI00082DD440|nr:hypothetical protein [Sphingomonas asaccharolytica]
MIALFALFAAMQTTPDAVPADQPDIVVVAERLKQVTVTVGRDPRGRSTCALSRSTGSASLDGQLCKTAAKCVKSGAVAPAAIAGCIDARKPALLDDLRRSLGKGRS